MTRTSTKGSDLANAVPLAPGHFKGPDGRPHVSINLATHKKFARACCDELAATERRQLHFLLGFAKSIDVPVSVLEGARARLGKPEGEEADGDV
jgi:hypothetical protein